MAGSREGARPSHPKDCMKLCIALWTFPLMCRSNSKFTGFSSRPRPPFLSCCRQWRWRTKLTRSSPAAALRRVPTRSRPSSSASSTAGLVLPMSPCLKVGVGSETALAALQQRPGWGRSFLPQGRLIRAPPFANARRSHRCAAHGDAGALSAANGGGGLDYAHQQRRVARCRAGPQERGAPDEPHDQGGRGGW